MRPIEKVKENIRSDKRGGEASAAEAGRGEERSEVAAT